MPSNETLQATVDGAVARVTLNKPERLNALDHAMLRELERLVGEWDEAAGIHVLVLTGAGARAFCAGADLEVLSRMDEHGMREWELMGNRVLERLQSARLVTVAAIRGHALGGGLTLAAACDFRIAAETATFAQPEIDLGWIPGWSGVARLARVVGPARAKMLSMTGRRLSAAEALEWGLVDEAAPADLFESRLEAFVEGLRDKSAPALQAIKRLSAECSMARPATGHEYDAMVNSALLRDPRGQAAIGRFLDKKR